MKESIFQMKSMLISQMNQKNVCSVTIGIFLDKSFSYESYLCDGCYNMTQKCNKLKNIAIVHIKESVYRICFLFMSKRETRKLMTNSNLTLICINWVPGDPHTIFLVTRFTQKMPERSDSMYSSIFMLENI